MKREYCIEFDTCSLSCRPFIEIILLITVGSTSKTDGTVPEEIYFFSESFLFEVGKEISIWVWLYRGGSVVFVMVSVGGRDTLSKTKVQNNN